MLKNKILRKIYITTVTMFILLSVFSISVIENKFLYPVSLELEQVTGISTNSIYLFNKSGYLVKMNILLDEEKVEDKVRKILNTLIVNENSKFSSELVGTIPSNVKINNIICGSDLVTIDFSKEFLDISVSYERQTLSSIVYSVLDIDEISGISILIDGKLLECYPNTKEKLQSVLDKSIGLNVNYDLSSFDDTLSVVVYYLTNIDDNLYYVPVTKVINDDRDKIKIIIEELTTSYIYEENLMSFLNSKTRLIDYREENNILFLNFNEFLYDYDDKVLEEVIYSISYSVFDNYDVNMVMFLVNGNDIMHISRNEI